MQSIFDRLLFKWHVFNFLSIGPEKHCPHKPDLSCTPMGEMKKSNEGAYTLISILLRQDDRWRRRIKSSKA